LKFERERIAEQPQQNEDAYELYQRGMFHHYRQSKAYNADAQTYFRRALALDPQYVQATAALSIALCAAAYLSWTDSPERNYEESLRAGAACRYARSPLPQCPVCPCSNLNVVGPHRSRGCRFQGSDPAQSELRGGLCRTRGGA
jgi:hypothetical protein